MAFIEKQNKGGKKYFYLTETLRTGPSFKKIRIRLSVDRKPSQKAITAAKQELKDKVKEAQKEVSLFPTKIDAKRIRDKHIVWERPCKLHLVFAAAEAVVNPQIKEYGHGWGITHCFFKENMVKIVWESKTLIKSGIHLINNFLNDEYFNNKTVIWEKTTTRLLKEYKKCKKKDLERLSDRELIRRYNEFFRVFLKWWGMSQVTECVSFGSEYLLKEKITDKEIALITTPSKKSYTTIEEETRLKIAAEIKKSKTLAKLFDKQLTEIVKGLQKHPALLEKLAEHQKKYYWIQNNYDTVQELDVKYFITQIKQMLCEIINPALQLKKMYQHQENLKKQKNNQLRQLNIEIKYKKLVKLVDYFAIFQDDRKAISIEANHYTNNFLKELSRRTGIGMKLIYFSMPYEYESILKGSFRTETLAEREKACDLIVSEKELRIAAGEEYQKIIKNILGRNEREEVTEFEGRRAEGGNVTGTVKIILDPRKAKKFNSGDILVTTMTSPEFTPIMKKAAAIVTDEGGITCHAAVVARELMIPCVVGTTIATSVLKDNDIVEVNANHGVIKIKR